MKLHTALMKNVYTNKGHILVISDRDTGKKVCVRKGKRSKVNHQQSNKLMSSVHAPALLSIISVRVTVDP